MTPKERVEVSLGTWGDSSRSTLRFGTTDGSLLEPLRDMFSALASGSTHSIRLAGDDRFELRDLVDVVLRASGTASRPDKGGTLVWGASRDLWASRVVLISPLIGSGADTFQWLDYEQVGEVDVVAEVGG